MSISSFSQNRIVLFILEILLTNHYAPRSVSDNFSHVETISLVLRVLKLKDFKID